ncbi:MAG: four helix bundle suffix domain-containing protein [Prevotella sp.]|nr:four helix bundle suffix domain-containing protein [Prevotella sp.]
MIERGKQEGEEGNRVQGAQGTNVANEANGTHGANGAYKANGTHGAYGTNGAKGANGDQQRKPLEPQPFLPKKGNYRGLLVYQKAECLYDITFYFAHHYFVERKDRTIDQVVQAARSGKQNIAEGCAAATTSAETEIKLLGVARASMQETLLDYEDYLRTRHLEQWPLNDSRTRQIQEYSKNHNRPEDYTKDIEKRSPEALCNIAITLIHQYDNMMGRLIDRLQKDFVEKGGIREQMTAARLGYRNDQKARIAELEAENSALKARVAELEALLRQKGGWG